MDPKFYKEYFYLERNHWWFTARLKILEAYISRLEISQGGEPLKILNAGVATGATSEMLSKFGEVVSLEYDEDCCDFLEARTTIVPVRGSLTSLPFDNEQFDLVCAFDVIEHIENDALACRELSRVLKSGGAYIITVPAFNFLWSQHDVVNHHYRRYSKTKLLHTLTSNQLVSTYSTFFNFLLFIPIAIYRVLQKVLPKSAKSKTSGSDNELFENSKWLNKLLHRVFLFENKLLAYNISLPWGVSLLSSGHKK